MPLQKATDFEDYSHDRWGTAPRCCTDEAGCVVCNALNSRTLEIDNTYYNQELLYEVWFLDHVSSNDKAVKFTEDEKNDWHRLQSLGVQSEHYPTCQCSQGLWSPEC
jgi:hypothetical protein